MTVFIVQSWIKMLYKGKICIYSSKNTIIFGQTGAGKTYFMLEVIRQKLIHPFPKNIYYMYNIEQDFMYRWNETEEQKITFIH